MKILTELSQKDWTLLGVCFSSVPMITLWLVVSRVLVVMVGTSVSLVGLRAGAILSIELEPCSPFSNKFPSYIYITHSVGPMACYAFLPYVVHGIHAILVALRVLFGSLSFANSVS